MNNLTGMMIFAQVVSSGSFSRAAEEMGMSKSSVSKKVSYLEDRLGVRLLNRTTRKLSLTEIGQVFYERCARIMSEAEEAELAITRLQDEARGHLRLSAPVSFGIRHLGTPLAEFMRQYPDVTLDVALNDRFVDIVDEGYDLAIRIGQLPDSSLIAKKIGESRMICAASKDYWDQKGRPAHPDDLLRHDCISYSLSRLAGQWLFNDTSKPHPVRLKAKIEVNNGDIACEMAANGAGVVMSPAFICGHLIAEGQLESVLEDFECEPINIYAVYPHNRHLSAKVRLFVDYLKGWLERSRRWER